MPFSRLFNNHPESVGETYLEHMRASLWFSATLARAAVCCFVHSFLPFLFTTTGSTAIERLFEVMIKARETYTQRTRAHSVDGALGPQGSLNH